MAETDTIPIIEEELAVSKRTERSGTVRVETKTALVDEIATAVLEASDVEILRVPINREVDQVPEVRNEGETMIVPVMEEVFVVEKRLVLKEELHIKRRVTKERVEVPITLRKQSATITRSED